MGEKTGISWCDHTFNPVWGCTRVSAGCVHCYAEDWARRWGVGWGPRAERRTFGDKHWGEPLRWNRLALAAGVRRRVFCGSMCDIFEDHPVVEAQVNRLIDLVYDTPALDWLLLTKRPERAALCLNRWMDGLFKRFPSLRGSFQPRWWLGTSVEDQETADQRIPILLRAPAGIRFISYEPALGPVDFEPHVWPQCIATRAEHDRDHDGGVFCDERQLDWIIVGGESEQGHCAARPFDIAWARRTIIQGRDAGVPVFVKQLGSAPWSSHSGDQLQLNDRKGERLLEWPPDLRVQEFPR